MNATQFALPTLSDADMTKNDQGALLLNQATALIVGAWLEHANVVLQNASALGVTTSAPSGGTNLLTFLVTPSELKGLIDSVQNGLLKF